MNVIQFVACAALALALGMTAGCSRGAHEGHDHASDGGHGHETPAVRAQAMIEEGNRAYGTGDYRLAARRYAAAAVVRKDDPAAFYGLGMALSKLGRDEDARRAYARAKQLAQGESEGGE